MKLVLKPPLAPIKYYQQETQRETEKINREIEEVEGNIKVLEEKLGEELTKLIEDFIEFNKRLIMDENNKEAREKTKELCKILEDKGISKENIEEIICYCEGLVDLEWQTEQWQAKIETPFKEK